MKRKMVLLFCICLILTSCNTKHENFSSKEIVNEHDSIVMEEETSETESEGMVISEDNLNEIPFYVDIDKTALQAGLVSQVTATINTELSDWEYHVKADYGKIQNINKYTFDYIKPKDEQQYKDVLTVYFTDKENKRNYEAVIPLDFPFPWNTVREVPLY